MEKKLITEKMEKKTPKMYVEYYKERKDKKGLFFINLGKRCVSDTPCPWQKYCRNYKNCLKKKK